MIRIGHAGLVRIRRKRKLHAPNLAHRVVLADQCLELPATSDGQVLAAKRSTLQPLKEVVHVDLLEQETASVQDVLAFADQVILDPETFIGERTTVPVARGLQTEFSLTIQGQSLDLFRHCPSLLLLDREYGCSLFLCIEFDFDNFGILDELVKNIMTFDDIIRMYVSQRIVQCVWRFECNLELHAASFVSIQFCMWAKRIIHSWSIRSKLQALYAFSRKSLTHACTSSYVLNRPYGKNRFV